MVMKKSGVAKTEQITTFLELEASSRVWAIPALDVVRIIEFTRPEPLPEQGLLLSAIVEYENQQVPFLSLGSLLEGTKESEGPIIIFDHKEGRIALGVSKVLTLKRIADSQLTPVPPIIGDKRFRDILKSCYVDGDTIIPVVDLGNLDI